MPLDYFVYYRVLPGQESEAKQALQQLLAEVAGRTGVRGTAHCKQGEPLLWMEIYRGVSGDGFAATLDAAVARCGILDCLEKNKSRKTECFAALAGV